ncbi:Rz-like spanin [Ralstonia phage RSB1]|uniref:I-spanin n=1 Tax=Ralstonia phage RSB1 TaxID=551790 RepID=B5BTY0_9CAUD|nr:Rz-like spanin [Ralstonia phage RSB1]BAG70402.1 hypothetical protein [Ralstonia phage RSB1]
MGLFDKIALGLIVALTAALATLAVLHRGQAARLATAEAAVVQLQAARTADSVAFKQQALRLGKLEAQAKERADAREKALDAHPDWSNAPVPADIAGRVR